MFFRIKRSGTRRYLQIVENTRDGAATCQRVVATLGRVEDLEAAGKLDRCRRRRRKKTGKREGKGGCRGDIPQRERGETERDGRRAGCHSYSETARRMTQTLLSLASKGLSTHAPAPMTVPTLSTRILLISVCPRWTATASRTTHAYAWTEAPLGPAR